MAEENAPLDMAARLGHLVEHYLALHLHENALLLAEELHFRFPSEVSAHLLASCYIYKGRAAAAVEVLRPCTAPANVYLFAKYALATGDVSSALDALLAAAGWRGVSLEEASRRAKEDPTPLPNGAAGALLAGECCAERGLHERAQEFVSAAVSHDPFLLSGYAYLAKNRCAPPPDDAFVLSESLEERILSHLETGEGPRVVLAPGGGNGGGGEAEGKLGGLEGLMLSAEARGVRASVASSTLAGRAKARARDVVGSGTSGASSTLAGRAKARARDVAAVTPVPFGALLDSGGGGGGGRSSDFLGRGGSGNGPPRGTPASAFLLAGPLAREGALSPALQSPQMGFPASVSPIAPNARLRLALSTPPAPLQLSHSGSQQRNALGSSSLVSAHASRGTPVQAGTPSDGRRRSARIARKSQKSALSSSVRALAKVEEEAGARVETTKKPDFEDVDEEEYVAAGTTKKPKKKNLFSEEDTTTTTATTTKKKKAEEEEEEGVEYSGSDDAARELEEAEESLLSSFVAVLKLLGAIGKVLYHAGQLELKEALEAAENVPRGTSGSGDRRGPLVERTKGRVLAACGRHARAAAVLSGAVRASPYESSGVDVLSTSLWHLRDTAQLSALARDWPGGTSAPEGWIVAANLASLRGSHTAAQRCLTAALRIEPRNEMALTLLGHERLAAADVAGARVVYRRALAVHPHHFPAWFGLAECASREGRPQRAKRLLQHALTIHPTSSALHAQLGLVLYALGDHMAAAASLLRACEADRGNAHARFHRAVVLADAGMPQKALADADIAIRLAPREAALRVLRARLLQKLGRKTEAVQTLNAALALRPRDPAAVRALLHRAADDDADEDDDEQDQIQQSPPSSLSSIHQSPA